MIGLSRVKIFDPVATAFYGCECFKLGPLYLTMDGKFFGWVVDEKGMPK